MALPLIVPLISSVLPSVIQAATAGKQKKDANSMKKNNFVPPAMEEALRRAKNNAGANMFPGQSNAQDQIRASTAGNINRAGRGGSFSDKLAVATAADKQEKQAFTNLGDTASKFALNNEQQVQGILGNKANVEMQNEQQFQADKRALRDASTQNIFNAASNLGTVAVSAAGGAFDGDMASQITSKNTPEQVQEMINSGGINLDSLSPDQRLKIMNYIKTLNTPPGLTGSPQDFLPVSNIA
jgi:hypothetical protein